MRSSAQDSYLETEVLTATPQKRQLMLIEGAIRFIERARHHWQAEENQEAGEALIRAQQIVTELLAGLNAEIAPDLVKKVAALYLFVFRTLIDANLSRDEKNLDDAVRVLEIQRETWRDVCRQLGTTTASESTSAAAPPAEQAPERDTPPLPFLPTDSEIGGNTSTGFSVEA